jgi:hypothetical protein
VANDFRRNRAVVERLAVFDHLAEVEQQPGLGEPAEEEPVHRPYQSAGGVHPEWAEEVPALADVGQLVEPRM